MSGLTPETPIPTGVVVHALSRVLELQYADGNSYRVPFELLRVYSPSAEVRGHGALGVVECAAGRRVAGNVECLQRRKE